MKGCVAHGIRVTTSPFYMGSGPTGEIHQRGQPANLAANLARRSFARQNDKFDRGPTAHREPTTLLGASSGARALNGLAARCFMEFLSMPVRDQL